MKFLFVFVVLVVAVCGEPPQYRINYLQQRQEVEAPYQAAGFRPAGQQFNLPARQTQQVEEPVPRTIYGPPTTEEAPTTTDLTTTEEPTTTLRPFRSQLNNIQRIPLPNEQPKTEEPETEEQSDESHEDDVTKTPDEENVEHVENADDEVEELDETQGQQQPTGQEGVYYFVLQNGQVDNKPRNMAYSTQLRYDNVQPISGPIYTFTPENQLYQIVY